MFFFYTLLGSVFVFFVFIYIFLVIGSSNFDLFFNYCFTNDKLFFIWFFLFIGFCFKVPSVPFIFGCQKPMSRLQLWVLLFSWCYFKGCFLCFFTFFSWFFFFYSNWFDLFYFCCFFYFFSFFFYGRFESIDIKKIIAYSSIAHMILPFLDFLVRIFWVL